MRSILAFLLVASALALTAVACGGDDDDTEPTGTAVSTVAGTPTVAATVAAPTEVALPAACSVHADICEHARLMEAALVAGDIDAVMGDTTGDAVTCAGGVVEPLSPTSPLCNGASAGEVRFGLRIAGYQSESSLVTVDEVAAFIKKWRDDEISAAGFGELRARTIGCSVADPACDSAYAVVLSVNIDEGRLLNLNFLRTDASSPEMSRAITGIPRLNPPLISGGEHGVPIPPFDEPRQPVTYSVLQ